MAAVFMLAALHVWAAPEPAGKADILTGTVTVERAGRQDALKPGDPLFLKDRVQTGAGSSAEIVFVDLSRMKLAANTSVEITEYLYNPAEKTRQGFISLTSGRARFAVQDLQEFRDKRFRVQTRTAVVGSRDTDFIVAFDLEVPSEQVCREGLVNAFCLENSVIVFSLEFPDKPALLTANMISQVCGRNLPTPPRFATPAERAGLLAGLEQIGKTNIPPPAPRGTIEGGETVGTPGDFTDITKQFPLPVPEIGINPLTSTTTTTTTTSLRRPPSTPTTSPCVGVPCLSGPSVSLHGSPGVNPK